MSRRRRKAPPKPYRSNFEHELATGPLKKLRYEPDDAVVEYSIEKKYKPDFVGKDPTILYEAKGRFRTYEEAMKYVWVVRSNPDITIRFIVGNPANRAYPQTKMTMGDWLTKQGFEWCTKDEVPKAWQK